MPARAVVRAAAGDPARRAEQAGAAAGRRGRGISPRAARGRCDSPMTHHRAFSGRPGACPGRPPSLHRGPVGLVRRGRAGSPTDRAPRTAGTGPAPRTSDGRAKKLENRSDPRPPKKLENRSDPRPPVTLGRLTLGRPTLGRPAAPDPRPPLTLGRSSAAPRPPRPSAAPPPFHSLDSVSKEVESNLKTGTTIGCILILIVVFITVSLQNGHA
jgi:hypothetical protein